MQVPGSRFPSRPPARKRKNFPNRFCGPLPPALRSRGRLLWRLFWSICCGGEWRANSVWRIQSGFLLCAVAFLSGGTLGGSEPFNFGIGFPDGRACPTLQSGKLSAVRKAWRRRADFCGFRNSSCGKEMPLLRPLKVQLADGFILCEGLGGRRSAISWRVQNEERNSEFRGGECLFCSWNSARRGRKLCGGMMQKSSPAAA